MMLKCADIVQDSSNVRAPIFEYFTEIRGTSPGCRILLNNSKTSAAFSDPTSKIFVPRIVELLLTTEAKILSKKSAKKIHQIRVILDDELKVSAFVVVHHHPVLHVDEALYLPFVRRSRKLCTSRLRKIAQTLTCFPFSEML